MQLDLLAADSYLNINKKLIKLTDIHTSLYTAELLNILRQVTKKKTYDESGFFKISRKYVEEQTTLNVEDQLNCDCLLAELEIVEVSADDKNKLRVDLRKLNELLCSDTDTKLDSIAKKVKVSKTTAAANRRAGQAAGMQRFITEEDPELKQLYFDWIDSVYAAKRFLTKKSIELFIDGVNTYTKDQAIKKNLLKMAISSGYTEISWIINSYDKNYGRKNILPSSQRLGGTKVAQKVDPNLKF